MASRFGIHLYVRAELSLATTEHDREQRPHVDTGGCQIRRSPLDARTAPGKSMFTMLQVPLWTVQSGASSPQTVRRRSATTQHRPTTVNGVSAAQKANRRYRPRSRHAVATLRLTGQLVHSVLRIAAGHGSFAVRGGVGRIHGCRTERVNRLESTRMTGQRRGRIGVLRSSNRP